MGQKFTYNRGTYLEVGFWLIFDASGSVRLTRGEPDLLRGERGMSVTAKVPHALFSKPTLKATINLIAPPVEDQTLDLSAASAALKDVLGVDIDLQVAPPT